MKKTFFGHCLLSRGVDLSQIDEDLDSMLGHGITETLLSLVKGIYSEVGIMPFTEATENLTVVKREGDFEAVTAIDNDHVEERVNPTRRTKTFSLENTALKY